MVYIQQENTIVNSPTCDICKYSLEGDILNVALSLSWAEQILAHIVKCGYC